MENQLENTVLELAQQKCIELKSIIEEQNGIENTAGRYHELSALVELSNIANSGLTIAAIQKLQDLYGSATSLLFNDEPK